MPSVTKLAITKVIIGEQAMCQAYGTGTSGIPGTLYVISGLGQLVVGMIFSEITTKYIITKTIQEAKKMYKNLSLLILIAILVFSPLSIASKIKSTTEINNMYYNLSQSKLKKFSCEVSTDVFEHVKEQIYSSLNEKDKKEIDSISFYFSYENKNFTLTASNYPEFSNEQMTKGMTQVIDGTDEMVTGFFTSWTSLVSEPLFTDNKQYDFIEKDNSYITNYEEDGNNVELIFDKDYVLQKITYSNENQKSIIIPKYVSTKEGLLITEMDFNIGNDMIHELIKIKYKKIKDIYLPENINIKINTFQSEQNITLNLFNFNVQ